MTVYTEDAVSLHIRNKETARLVRALAAARGIGLTEAVHLAVKKELERAPLIERIRPLQERLAKIPNTGLVADKAFFDSLEGDD